MAQIDITRLSEGIRKDYTDFQKTGEDAIFWLGTGQLKTTDEIIKRFQTARMVEVALSGLKTSREWKVCNSALNDIRESSGPLSVTNKFSSYSLKENKSSIGTLRYPLSNSFASKSLLFAKKEFPEYRTLISRIENAYKVKITEHTSRDKLFSYKKTGKVQALIKNAGIKSLNLCKKIFKKNTFKTEPSYKGKIRINNNFTFGDGYSYKISQQEKFTRVLDAIMNVTVKNCAQQSKAKLSKNELFVSRLYAEILLSRAINYGDKTSNANVESSLTLQLSNTLATLDLSPEKIQKAAQVGLKSALDAIKKMGLTISDIKESVTNAGYVYKTEPKTIEEALMPTGIAKEASIAATPRPVRAVAPVEEIIPETPEEEVVPPVVEVTPPKKITKKEDLVGVKNDTILLTRSSAKKYIDRVIEDRFKTIISNSVSGIFDENVKEKKTTRFGRQYNFVEHMLAYYNKNKDVDSEVLIKQIEQELSSDMVNDNNYAHSFSQSFITLRNHILSEIFGENDTIEKVDGKRIATVVNDYVQSHYGKTLRGYISDTLNKSFVPMFKEIDSNKFTPRNIIEVEKDK